jgi:hypothetical protein
MGVPGSSRLDINRTERPVAGLDVAGPEKNGEHDQDAGDSKKR